MNQPPSVVLTAEDSSELDRIAAEVEDPNTSKERRVEMLAQLREMADRYRCDPRLTDN